MSITCNQQSRVLRLLPFETSVEDSRNVAEKEDRRFVLWPAECGDAWVCVEIDIDFLMCLSSRPLGISNSQIRDAMIEHRSFIEQAAQRKYTSGNRITLRTEDLEDR